MSVFLYVFWFFRYSVVAVLWTVCPCFFFTITIELSSYRYSIIEVHVPNIIQNIWAQDYREEKKQVQQC